MSLETKMKSILLALVFCFSFVIAQKQLTSYQREYPFTTEEFPLFVEPFWHIQNVHQDCYGSFILAGRTLLFSENGFLKALDVKTGKSIWELGGFECPDIIDGEGLLYVMKSDSLYALRATTGQEEWSRNFEGYKGISTFYDKGTVFLALINDYGYHSKILRLDAQSGNTIWEHEEKNTYFYNSFEVYGNTAKVDFSIWTSIGSGVAFLDLKTGQWLWSTGSGRMGGEGFLYADEANAYFIGFSSGAPSVLGPVTQYDIKIGKVLSKCGFDAIPSVLSQRYVFSPELPYGLNAMLRGTVTEGEWIYATVGNDLHRFPLCGVTPAFTESIGEPIAGDASGNRKRYELPTLIFSWNNDYSYYFGSEGGSPFLHEEDLRWIAGPSEGVFLFYSDEAEELYGVHEIPRNCIEVKEGKLVGSPFTCDSEYVTIREYPAVNSEISRLDIIDGLVFVGTIDGIFHVFDLHTQELIFHTRVNSPNFAPFHLIDDIAIIETLNGEVMAFKLDLPNKE
jgi:outer membrane protein assembly factor BamB